MSRYSDRTFENLQAEAFQEAEANGLDVSEGSLANIALAKSAVRFQDAYMELDYVNDNMMVDTMEREFLEETGAEAGLPIDTGKAAVLLGTLNVQCSIGDIFSAADSDFNYMAIAYVGEATDADGNTLYQYHFEAEDNGVEPGLYRGDIEPEDALDGFEAGTLNSLVSAGEDEEATEDYRERRLNFFGTKACAGNRAYYNEVLGGLEGVGGFKIPRRQAGETYLSVYVVGPDYGTVPAETLAELKRQADPEEYEGEGYGLAPIGHSLRFFSVTEKGCSITSTLTFETGMDYEQLRTQIADALEAYFLSLRQTWAGSDGLVVRIANIDVVLMGIDGIVDVSGTAINGDAANVTCGEYEIPAFAGFAEG